MAKNRNKAATDRRARIEEMRRAEAARDRRNKILAISAATVILAATIGGGWYLFSAAEEEEQAKTAPMEGEKTWDKLGRDHVEKDVDYPMTPAVGGEHSPVWANCDSEVYTKELKEENAVHSLEHGAVWISYNDKASRNDVKALTERVEKTSYTFISPNARQSSPITLSAWGHQLTVKKASDPRVGKFVEKYVQGEQTPEPGAACTGGTSA
ncbi:DUF3105 domain-containing protein [Streptomyces armeniacus]|uniref:DUF3105 domain-containing protein n=1 Tax=Streptomyces armeniacus TaxID=83291 RepID=A0A345XRY3_9ACTN|nr:DUF3105 domain-containing protein [Streptomyces armeniacus]AXK34399.1 DUF3105 domain-containing protein [Streptomyces armeniacus]